MDESLQPYARAWLLRAIPNADYRSIEAYVASEDFKALAKVFDKNLIRSLERFMSTEGGIIAPTPQADRKPDETPRPLQLADLSPMQPPPAPLEIGAVPAAAVPFFDSGPQQAPMPEAPPPPSPRPIQTAPPEPELADVAFRLPNARAGNTYAQRIAPADTNEAVVFDRLVVPEGLSMTADPETGMLSGTPVTAGEYTVTVVYHFARQSPGRQRRAAVRLEVTPDPRTMWKNLPSDREAPYWKEDEACSTVQGSDLRIVAASKRGRSHAHVGSFRDDDYRIAHAADTGWYVAVVADGAGGSRYSRRGAALIVEEARARILTALGGDTTGRIDSAAQAWVQARADALPPEQVASLRDELHTCLSRIVGNAAYYAAVAIGEETKQRADLGAVFKDYSSTALIAVCKRYPFGTLCAAYWVGDGAIGIYSKRDGVILLGDVDSGEFSGQTRFLDHAAVDHEVLRNRTRFEIVDDMTALVLMTDGVSDAKFETEARLGRSADWHLFWEEIEREAGLAGDDAGQEARLLAWLDFWSQGNHDDRTIAIIH